MCPVLYQWIRDHMYTISIIVHLVLSLHVKKAQHWVRLLCQTLLLLSRAKQRAQKNIPHINTSPLGLALRINTTQWTVLFCTTHVLFRNGHRKQVLTHASNLFRFVQPSFEKKIYIYILKKYTLPIVYGAGITNMCTSASVKTWGTIVSFCLVPIVVVY